MPSSRIVLFATPSCPRCAEARAAIAACGESWVEYDPTSSPGALRELLGLVAPAAVPTIVIGNRALVGFDRDRFERMLREAPLEPEDGPPYSSPEE